jgi:hypothetical protein
VKIGTVLFIVTMMMFPCMPLVIATVSAEPIKAPEHVGDHIDVPPPQLLSKRASVWSLCGSVFDDGDGFVDDDDDKEEYIGDSSCKRRCM